MAQKKKYKNEIHLRINHLPTLGIICFVCLFIFSASRYPGGSQANPNTIGYDWVNTYWCSLMSKTSMNGELNVAREYAIAGMVVLCTSLMIFFYQFSKTLVTNIRWRNAMITGGIVSMISASLMFTKYHDLMTTISSIFGLIVVLGIIRSIYHSSLTIYKITGLICLMLLLINNLIYYTTYKVEWLPLIQKITFAVVLSWVIGLNFQIRKRLIMRNIKGN